MKIRCKGCGKVLDTKKTVVCSCGSEFDSKNNIFYIYRDFKEKKEVNKEEEKEVNKEKIKEVNKEEIKEKNKELSSSNFIDL